MPQFQEPEKTGNRDPLIVFLHIPKTAGTSLYHLFGKKFGAGAIAPIYTPSECARPLPEHAADLQDSVSCLSGHINFGIHHHLSRECAYISMLRDPVSRVLSHYHFTRSKDARTHSLGEVIEFAQNSTIIEYLQRFPGIAFEQITTLSGTGSLDRNALQLAKDNITSGRIRVGLTEDFFRSTEMIFQEYGLGYPRFSWKRKNTGAHGKSHDRKTIDASTRAAIEDICAFDIELYQHTHMYHEARMLEFQSRPRTLIRKAQHELFQRYCQLLD